MSNLGFFAVFSLKNRFPGPVYIDMLTSDMASRDRVLDILGTTHEANACGLLLHCAATEQDYDS